jgi:hypothetical protein
MGKWNYPFPPPQADRVGRLDLWRLGWRLWSSLLRGGNSVREAMRDRFAGHCKGNDRNDRNECYAW